MPKLATPLTDIQPRTAKRKYKPYKLTDGGGLYLLVNPDGSKYWRMGYRFGGVQRLLAFGKYPEISLADARKARAAARAQINAGIDPAQTRRIEKRQKAIEAANTFEAIAREWHRHKVDSWQPRTSTNVLFQGHVCAQLSCRGNAYLFGPGRNGLDLDCAVGKQKVLVRTGGADPRHHGQDGVIRVGYDEGFKHQELGNEPLDLELLQEPRAAVTKKPFPQQQAFPEQRNKGRFGRHMHCRIDQVLAKSPEDLLQVRARQAQCHDPGAAGALSANVVESPCVGIDDRRPRVHAHGEHDRSGNRGKSDYRPEDDHRHFLYREYLRIIQKYRPAVFVMENVKGILSSKVGGEHIFHSILDDLSDPDRAIGKVRSRPGYRIHSLSNDVVFERGGDAKLIDARKFIVRAEEYGIPQARHRVILLGVREDIESDRVQTLSKANRECPLADALAGLPPLRSSLSRQEDCSKEWQETVREHFRELAQAARRQGSTGLAARLARLGAEIPSDLTTGGLRVPRSGRAPQCSERLRKWYDDSNLSVWLNHEARGHMSLDLMRYAYAATFALEHERSPKGHEEFNLIEKLRPLHANWESGKFSDRFRVQRLEGPATTITSHISKDGHYFIHPDPAQCRSLTVREAARVQTFPDNYFFQGNRTQQYHQVGNAVPPLLAHQIANVVYSLLNGDPSNKKRQTVQKGGAKRQQTRALQDICS